MRYLCKRKIAAVIALGASFAAVASAQATIVDVAPGSFSSDFDVRSNVYVAPEGARNFSIQHNVISLTDSIGNTGKYGGTSSASLSLDGSSRPTISAQASGSSPTGPGSSDVFAASSAFGQITYEFVIHGPTETVPVLIDAYGMLRTSAHTSRSVGAEIAFSVYDPRGYTPVSDQLSVLLQDVSTVYQQGSVTVSGSEASGYTGELRHNAVYDLTTDIAYRVQIIAYAGGGAAYTFGWGSYSAMAFIDPYFAIASGTPNADLYSIEFSAGIGNQISAGVPEPSTWAMMLVGFCGLGVAATRKRKWSTVAP